jgi:hypothetical protein
MKRRYFFVLVLIISSFVYSQKVTILKHLIQPKNIHVDGDRIYITDYPEIHIYATTDHKLLKTFGGKGQGPGEFFLATELPDTKEDGLQIVVKPDYILVNSQGRISFFTKDGIFEKMKKFHAFAFASRFFPLGDGFVAFKPERENNNKIFYSVNIYNSNLERTKEIYRHPFFMPKRKGEIHYFAREGLLYTVYDDKLFITNSGMDELIIHVFDNTGKKLHVITGDYEKIKITETQIKQYREGFKYKFKRGLDVILKRTVFPEYFPAIRHFNVSDGKVYVMTFKKEAGKSEAQIFDLKGTLLEKTMIPIKEKNSKRFFPYDINKAVLYQLVENEDEEWELHVTKVH